MEAEIKHTKETEQSSTPFDDVFRTMLNDCSYLILPLLNEAFGEHYTGDEAIVFGINEHYKNRAGGNEDKLITDSFFTVYSERGDKVYHIECQSTQDGAMLVRLFEYDAQIALDTGEVRDGRLYVDFPNTAVLYLRSTVGTPDEMEMVIRSGDAEMVRSIPVVKADVYSVDDIFAKDLLFLVPFYILHREKSFPIYERNPEKLEELKCEFLDIRQRLEARVTSGSLPEYGNLMITDMMRKIVVNVTGKYDNVRKGVESTMRGRILDYEAKDILNKGRIEGLNEGRKEGLNEGRKEGLNEGRSSIIFTMYSNGLALDQIAKFSGLDLSVVEDAVNARKSLTGGH